MTIPRKGGTAWGPDWASDESSTYTATGTSTPTLLHGMVASPEIAVTAQSDSSATFAGAGDASIEMTTDVEAKILGEDWIDTDVGTEVWSDVALGSEVWANQDIGEEVWFKQ